MKMTFDDKMGHRGRRHQNLIAARFPDGKQVIFPFTGKSVPGVAQVFNEDYNKNGKWSATYWDVELAEGVIGFVKTQDWETGKWINAQRWQEAIEEFKDRLELDEDAIVRFIRAEWKNVAARLDKAEAESKMDSSAALQELLAAQQELANAQQELAAAQQELAQMEEVELARQEAAAIKERVAAAKKAMKNGASLADLKALLG